MVIKAHALKWVGKFKFNGTYNVHSVVPSMLYVLNNVTADDKNCIAGQ